MSPNGRFVGGYAASVAPDDSWQYSPVITDLETGEVYEFGPYPEAIHFLTQTMCISDHGVLFIKDGYNGGTVAFDTEGNITEPRSPEGYKGKPTIEATSSDGKYWVGYANDDILSEGGLTRPLLWTDGIPAELPFPDKNFRNEDFRVGIMARGISAISAYSYSSTARRLKMVRYPSGRVSTHAFISPAESSSRTVGGTELRRCAALTSSAPSSGFLRRK